MSEPVLPGKADFFARLEAMPGLRTFPAVATRVLAVCGDDNVNARNLVEIIRCDPTLSIQLLRVANSPAYGFSGQIKSLEHAAVVLGFRSVKSLAVSVAAASVFAEGQIGVRQREALWEHSLACAIIARRLAPSTGEVDPEDAFIAGMVHDVGKLVFLDLASESYDYDPTRLVSVPTSQQEVDEFGIDHGQLGHRCGVAWGLPEDINAAITYHHKPQAAQWAHELVSIVYAANRFAKTCGLGPQAEDGSNDPLVNIPDVDLGLDQQQLEQIMASVPEEFADLSRAFAT